MLFRRVGIPFIFKHFQGVDQFGPGVYAICLAYRVVVTVAWAIRQGRTDLIDYFVRSGRAVCEDLKGLRTED